MLWTDINTQSQSEIHTEVELDSEKKILEMMYNIA